MFERFTDAARRVVVLAQEEARLLRHDYVGTEHLLLGLLEQGGCAAVLRQLGVDHTAARRSVLETVAPGPDEPSGHIPFTPGAKKALELSLREAIRLEVREIGPPHLLLGLIGEGVGVASAVLSRLGVELETARTAVRAL